MLPRRVKYEPRKERGAHYVAALNIFFKNKTLFDLGNRLPYSVSTHGKSEFIASICDFQMDQMKFILFLDPLIPTKVEIGVRTRVFALAK